jgi:hypothetical protein
LRLLRLPVARPVVGESLRRIAFWIPDHLHRSVGRIDMDTVVNAEREPLAACR